MFPLICIRINGWVKKGEAGDLRRYRAHCDVTVMNHLNLSGYTVIACQEQVQNIFISL